MTLKKSEKRLLVVLGVAVVVFLFDRFVGIPVGKRETSPKTEEQRIQTLNAVLSRGGDSSGPVDGSRSVVAATRRFETWGRDPFTILRTSAVQRSSTAGVELKGIFWKQGRPYVLIDEHVLSEGEEKQGIRVEKIERTEVLCRRGSRSFTLHWRESP